MAAESRILRPEMEPIFVIGTGRSGTTLLRCMLCAHPRIYIVHEASFYFWEAKFSKRRSPSDFVQYYLNTPEFRWLRLAPERVLSGFPNPLPKERLRDFYTAVIREKAAAYGRPRYGEKMPMYSWHLPRIFEDFPDARVVHIVRDPRATVASLVRMPWAGGSVFSNALYCELERKKVAEYEAQIHRVRLEDLLSEPKKTMERVLEFVGEPWDDAVLDHVNRMPDPNDMPPFPWLENARRSRVASREKWPGLSPAQIRMIERTTRSLMSEFGYERAELEQEPSRLSQWWAALREVPEILRCHGVWIQLTLLLRNSLQFDSDEFVRLFGRINPAAWVHYPGFEYPRAPPLALPGDVSPWQTPESGFGTRT